MPAPANTESVEPSTSPERIRHRKLGAVTPDPAHGTRVPAPVEGFPFLNLADRPVGGVAADGRGWVQRLQQIGVADAVTKHALESAHEMLALVQLDYRRIGSSVQRTAQRGEAFLDSPDYEIPAPGAPSRCP